jgi:hypothetical protein
VFNGTFGAQYKIKWKFQNTWLDGTFEHCREKYGNKTAWLAELLSTIEKNMDFFTWFSGTFE